MRLPSRHARAPRTSPAGPFTFSSVPAGIGHLVELLDDPRDERGAERLEVAAAAGSPPATTCCERTGMPSMMPSSAAATVPE